MIALFAALLAAAAPDLQSWLQQADATRNAFDEAVITARASQVDRREGDGERRLRGVHEGTRPRLDRLSRREQQRAQGPDRRPRMWLIVPGASRPIPVSPNQRLLGGASMGDVASLRFAEDFTAVLRPEPEAVRGKNCRVLDLTAKSPNAPYPHVVLWWNEAERLPAGVSSIFRPGRKPRRSRSRSSRRRREDGRLGNGDPGSPVAGSARRDRLEYLDYRPVKIDDAVFTPEGARAP